jgi:hypothetical protein
MIKLLAGPDSIPNSAGNIYTPPSDDVYAVLRHFHFVNVTASQATFSMYIGATSGTTAGTEIFKDFPIPAKGTYDYWCYTKLLVNEYVSAIASAASAIVVTVEGDLEAT